MKDAISFNYAMSISVVLLCAQPANAEQNTSTQPSAYAIESRLNMATDLLQSQKAGATYWEYSWGSFNGVSMMWSAFEATQEHDYRSRRTDRVQAVESLIGLADVIFRPLPAFRANEDCSGQSMEQDQLRCLAAKEALLVRSASRAQDPFEIIPHLENLAFNIAAGTIVWRLADTKHALATLIPGEIVGEVQLWTMPQQPITDLRKYKIQISPMLLLPNNVRGSMGGLMVTLSF